MMAYSMFISGHNTHFEVNKEMFSFSITNYVFFPMLQHASTKHENIFGSNCYQSVNTALLVYLAFVIEENIIFYSIYTRLIT